MDKNAAIFTSVSFIIPRIAVFTNLLSANLDQTADLKKPANIPIYPIISNNNNPFLTN